MAAFQNPEFYKAQAMRLSTYNKPRIISCCEDFSKYIGIPRGCLDKVEALLHSLKIKTKITDKRFFGTPISVTFKGTLRAEQQTAAHAMLKYDTGVLSATTAFGKTVIAAYLIAKRKVNTQVLRYRLFAAMPSKSSFHSNIILFLTSYNIMLPKGMKIGKLRKWFSMRFMV